MICYTDGELERDIMTTANQTSLLAKLLATENVTVQKTPGIKTAMFDLRNRVLMLPIWEGISNDLEDLLLVHETGHALDTPNADEYKAAGERLVKKIFPNEEITKQLHSTVQGFINVIEDARIDKRQKRRYPGSRKNYLVGYKELFERDFFGTANRDINSMNFIDRLNLYFKGGNIHSQIDFTPEEKVMLKKVENAETWDEVITLTEEIYLYCKKKLEDMSEMESDIYVAGEGDGDDDIDGDWEYIDVDGEGDEGSKASQGEGDQDGEMNNGGAGGLHGAPSQLPSNAPVSHTDNTWQRKSQEIVKDENSVFVYVNQPEVNWDKAINDYKMVLADWKEQLAKNEKGYHQYGDSSYFFNMKNFHIARENFTKWKMKEKETVSFMVKEFEQRKAAELYAKINIAKTGVIDTNKMHTYKYNDDIFRRVATIPKGKNHGFVMFLDWSGSMHYGLDDTMKQLFSLCMFCKQINVPFEVYAFKDAGADNPFSHLNKENCITGGRLVLRNFLSSRMKLEELNFAMTTLWFLGHGGNINHEGMGGTPLNDAIMIAPKVVNDFTARNKLEITNVIWLTDGESNGSVGIKNETAPRVHGKNRRYFYVDPNTRKTYDWHPHSYYSATENTITLLRILKDATNCNLIGFYLLGGTFNRVASTFNIGGDSEAYTKGKKFWSDNKFYPVKSAGYDEYYIIDTNALKDKNNDLAIDNTGEKKMTAKRMAAAFSKFAKKKIVNRVLLRQFAERISGHAKKAV